MRIETPEFVRPEIGRDTFYGPRLDPGLQVTVIYTTPEGTLAALKAAGALANDLNARVGLIVTEVVPFRLPLDQPRVSVEFLKERQDSLVSEAGIEGEEVRVQICLCRDRKHTLRQVLAPRSLVVIGGRRKWWSSREQQLEKCLSRLGHHVIFVHAKINHSPDTFAEQQNRPAARFQTSPQ
jgi:hypothetical protein